MFGRWVVLSFRISLLTEDAEAADQTKKKQSLQPPRGTQIEDCPSTRPRKIEAPATKKTVTFFPPFSSLPSGAFRLPHSAALVVCVARQIRVYFATHSTAAQRGLLLSLPRLPSIYGLYYHRLCVMRMYVCVCVSVWCARWVVCDDCLSLYGATLGHTDDLARCFLAGSWFTDCSLPYDDDDDDVRLP